MLFKTLSRSLLFSSWLVIFEFTIAWLTVWLVGWSVCRQADCSEWRHRLSCAGGKKAKNYFTRDFDKLHPQTRLETALMMNGRCRQWSTPVAAAAADYRPFVQLCFYNNMYSSNLLIFFHQTGSSWLFSWWQVIVKVIWRSSTNKKCAID